MDIIEITKNALGFYAVVLPFLILLLVITIIQEHRKGIVSLSWTLMLGVVSFAYGSLLSYYIILV